MFGVFDDFTDMKFGEVHRKTTIEKPYVWHSSRSLLSKGIPGQILPCWVDARVWTHLMQLLQVLWTTFGMVWWPAFCYGMVDQMRKGVKTLDHLEEGGRDVAYWQ